MTKKAYTYEILGGYLMDNNKLNVGYLVDLVKMTGDNTEKLYNMIKETRIKPRNVAITWTKYFVDMELKFNGYEKYTCTNSHLMDFDMEHGETLSEVIDIIEKYIIEERIEL